jgi:ABC-2 type transport system permease protein
MDGPDLKMSGYAQYLTPLIVLQPSLSHRSPPFRAATDSVQGINRRFQSLPISPLTPLTARIAASVYRCVIGLVVALMCGYVIGFRFHRGRRDIGRLPVLVLAHRPGTGVLGRSSAPTREILQRPRSGCCCRS